MDNEEVRYSYTSDNSDLIKKTEQVIKKVDEVGSTMSTTHERAQSMFKGANVEGFATTLSGILVPLQSIESEMERTIVEAQKMAEKMNQAFSKASTSSVNNSGTANVNSDVIDLTQNVSYLGSQMATMPQKVVAAFNTMRATLQSYKDKIIDTFVSTKERTKESADAFRRLAEEHSSVDALDDSVKKTTESVKKLKEETSKVGKEASSSSKGFLAGLKKIHVTIVAILAVLKKIAQVASKAIGQSIEYVETLNLFNVAMGESAEAGSAFVEQMREIYGMSPSNLMRYAGNFYQLAGAIDMPDEAARKLSLTLTKATNDLSSLFNIPIEEVFTNLSSGMQGMTRAVRKYGIDIRTVTLQQEALALGLSGKVTEMNEANRQGLRFLTIMKQTTKASGDFARTIESPANQLKIFKEQVAQLGKAVGDFLIEPLSEALAYINGFIMALRMLIEFLGKLLGVNKKSYQIDLGKDIPDEADDIADAVSGIGSAADSTGKKIKNMLAPFDELNILQQNQDTGSDFSLGASSDVLDPAIAQAIADMELSLENVRMKANDVRDSILEFFGLKVENGEIKFNFDNNKVKQAIESFEKFKKTFEPLVKTVKDSWENHIKPFFDRVSEYSTKLWEDTIKPIWEGVKPIFDDLGEFLVTLTDIFIKWFVNPIIDGLKLLWPVIDSVIQATLEIAGSLISAFDGVIRFFTDTFKGDWKAVWDDLEQICASIFDAIQNLLIGAVNIMIDIVNALVELFWPVIKALGDLIGKLVQFFGGSGWTMSVDAYKISRIPYVNSTAPISQNESHNKNMIKVPKGAAAMATGGVVTRPTLALVGEAGRNEAVIPLDNSPQMNDFAQQIANKIESVGSNNPVNVHVYIGGEEFDSYMYEVQTRREVQTNGG